MNSSRSCSRGPRVSPLPRYQSFRRFSVNTTPSGCIGIDRLNDEMYKCPLGLEFEGKIRQENEYLADVLVHIADRLGANLLNVLSQRQIMFASLPNGRYNVSARYEGPVQQRVVDVMPSSPLCLWPTQSRHADGNTT